METFKKENEFEVSITAEVKEPEVIVKDLSQLEEDLKQAEDSLVYILQRQADETAPIQVTIDLLRKRVDKALKLGIVSKPVEEIIEPIEEIIK